LFFYYYYVNMAQKKSKLAKFFIYLVLFFIIFSFWAIYIVMYAWMNWATSNNCEDWYVFNEETWECELVLDDTENNEENISLNNEESCVEQGWTWYTENNICILPEAQ